MFVLLSKLLPPFIYPLGIACLLVAFALFLGKRPALQRTALLIALLLLWAGSTRWAAFLTLRQLEWQHLPPQAITQPANAPVADAIVLLGGATLSGDAPRPGVELNGAGDRVIYAARLYRQGKAPRLLATSGSITWLEANRSPSGDMRDLLVELGVAPQDILMETRSQNTYENALFSRPILEQQGVKRIILVTSAWHMPRSLALFEKQGFEVIPAPTDFYVTYAEQERMFSPNPVIQITHLLPSAQNLADVSLALKEYLGIFIYWLQGWL